MYCNNYCRCCCYPTVISNFPIKCDPVSGDGDCDCFCIKQMKNILNQIINMYSNSTFVVTLENGSEASGRPTGLLPSSENAGLLRLLDSQRRTTNVVSICKIASIKISNVSYNNNINFLYDTSTGGCCSDCQNAIEGYLTVGTRNVSIKAGGKQVASGTVLKDEDGMVVIQDNPNDLYFISTCKIEATQTQNS